MSSAGVCETGNKRESGGHERDRHGQRICARRRHRTKARVQPSRGSRVPLEHQLDSHHNPSHEEVGTVGVTVTAAGKCSERSPADQYTYN
jgi:hypothetical protein